MKKPKNGVKKVDSVVFDASIGVIPEHFEDEDDFKGYLELVEKRKRWWTQIKKYKLPTESMSQFSIRCGEERDAAFHWKGNGRKPKPSRALAILEALKIPEDEARRIYNLLVGARELPGGATEPGYVYPDEEGTANSDGRLGFRTVWLETCGIKPELVKLVVCDTAAMFPQIHQRDLMLVDMSKTTPRNEKIYLVEITDEPDNQIVCKLFSLPGKQFNITFLNNDVYPNYKINQDMVLIHGEVVFVGRML